MIGMYMDLPDKAILQNFLMEFHQRQTETLRNIPKALLGDVWFHGVHLFISLIGRKGRKKTCEQYSNEIIKPFTDEIIKRIDVEASECDLLIFHTLLLPKSLNGSGHVESLDGVTARILTLNTLPDGVTRIDISFTPMYLKNIGKDRLYFVGRDEDYGKYDWRK